MVWPSSFAVCFCILAFLARYLSARRYRQRVYPLTADPTCSFARTYRLRCLSQLRSARMTFGCSLFASPRLFRCYSNSVNCTTRFSTLIYRADCLFQGGGPLVVENREGVFSRYPKKESGSWGESDRGGIRLWGKVYNVSAKWKVFLDLIG